MDFTLHVQFEKKTLGQKGISSGRFKELPEKADAIYITDTYGVFFNEWYQGFNKRTEIEENIWRS